VAGVLGEATKGHLQGCLSQQGRVFGGRVGGRSAPLALRSCPMSKRSPGPRPDVTFVKLDSSQARPALAMELRVMGLPGVSLVSGRPRVGPHRRAGS